MSLMGNNNLQLSSKYQRRSRKKSIIASQIKIFLSWTTRRKHRKHYLLVTANYFLIYSLIDFQSLISDKNFNSDQHFRYSRNKSSLKYYAMIKSEIFLLDKSEKVFSMVACGAGEIEYSTMNCTRALIMENERTRNYRKSLKPPPRTLEYFLWLFHLAIVQKRWSIKLSMSSKFSSLSKGKIPSKRALQRLVCDRNVNRERKEKKRRKIFT